jgi:hypothetical protein
VLPVGTLRVNLAQRQKHIIHGMLAENTYVPFPYFYDTTGWSHPILENVFCGYSGQSFSSAISKQLTQVAPLPRTSRKFAGKVAILSVASPTESFSWAVFTLQTMWEVDFEMLTALQISNSPSDLNRFDVLLVADVVVNTVLTQLGPSGVAIVVHLPEFLCYY